MHITAEKCHAEQVYISYASHNAGKKQDPKHVYLHVITCVMYKRNYATFTDHIWVAPEDNIV